MPRIFSSDCISFCGHDCQKFKNINDFVESISSNPLLVCITVEKFTIINAPIKTSVEEKGSFCLIQLINLPMSSS